MAKPEFLRINNFGIELFIRATPNAKIDLIDGVEIRDDGKAYLKVKTRAIADDGMANNEIIKIIAKKLEISKSEVSIVSGFKGRIKTLLVKSKNLDIGKVELLLNPDGKS